MSKITINSSITRAFAPDMVSFNIHITRVADNSAELVCYNKDKITALAERASELGIDDDNLREVYFRIGINRERVEDKLVDNGYKLDSEYSITSYIDYELMDSIRDMLVELDLPYSTEYSLEDEVDLRDSLLREAVEQSLIKAKRIASAGGRHVGEMGDVHYNDVTRPMMLRSASRDSVDVAPHDIEITESVEVEWELE